MFGNEKEQVCNGSATPDSVRAPRQAVSGDFSALSPRQCECWEARACSCTVGNPGRRGTVKVLF